MITCDSHDESMMDPPSYPRSNSENIQLREDRFALPIPSYDDLYGAKEEAEISGPIYFKVDWWSPILIAFTSLIQFSAKVILGIIASNTGYGWIALLYFVAIINVWLIVIQFHKTHMVSKILFHLMQVQTLLRFSLRRLIVTPYPHLFFLDIFIYLGLPLFSQDQSLKYQLYIGITAAALTCLSFYVTLHFETIDHRPFHSNDQFLPVTTYEENIDNFLSVKAWSAFRISLLNIGDKTLNGRLFITRKVQWKEHFGKVTYREAVDIVFKFPGPLKPGEEITLIPETHKIRGAFAIKDFRSFGRKDRGLLVELIVYLSEKEKKKQSFSVRRAQLFVKINN